MTIEQAIRNKLIATTGVTNLVAHRIYFVGRVAQNVTMPYIVIQTIDDIPTHSHQGNSHLNTARIQINCFDDEYLDCKAVDAAIFAALDSFSGTLSGLTIGSILSEGGIDFPNDDNPNISGIHTDYMVTYNT